MNDQSRIKIAIQKSGRLSDESHKLLKQSGIKLNRSQQRLIAYSTNMPIDILHVRDDDIPGLVFDGIVDLGITGENVLQEELLKRRSLEQPCAFTTLRQLDFGGCRLSLAAPNNFDYQGLESLRDKRIATSYPYLLKSFLDERNIPFKSCLLAGSVEIAPRAGLADVICDLVSTGVTLEANGLREIETIFRSRSTLIQKAEPLSEEKQNLINKFLNRIQGVIQARESKYIMLHASKNNLKEIISLLPGAEEPTILPLTNETERVALHMVSAETLFWETMEALKALGASSILVLPIEKMME